MNYLSVQKNRRDVINDIFPRESHYRSNHSYSSNLTARGQINCI